MGTLDWAWHDDKRFFLYESKEFFTDGFELGLRLGYAFREAKYEIALFGRNITDAEIVRGGIDFNNLTGFTNDPRIIGIEFIAAGLPADPLQYSRLLDQVQPESPGQQPAHDAMVVGLRLNYALYKQVVSVNLGRALQV